VLATICLRDGGGALLEEVWVGHGSMANAKQTALIVIPDASRSDADKSL
jgi:hypothetical protein